MEFKSYLSAASTPEEAANELLSGKIKQNEAFDLGLLFSSTRDSAKIKDIASRLKAKLAIRNLMGCTSAGIVGSHNEIEHRMATTLILAKLPEVKIVPFVMAQAQLEGLSTQEDWHNFFEVHPGERPIFIILPDPFMFDIHAFVNGLNQAYPNCPVVGGLASAAESAGENTLILNQEEWNEGVVGVVLTGNVRVETVVSQGCRPIDETFIVTKAEGNLIYSLAGKPFIEVLQYVLQRLPTADQTLVQEAVFVGIAMNEYTHQFKRGDFLIRGLMGIDQETGAGVIADYIQPGQTVQFHLRDAATAREDLNELLMSHHAVATQKPKGALVFCCNGRGESLFREKDHDIKVIQKYLGPLPAAGFFCAGEIGPVGKSNFLHGFTNSIALFYPRDDK